jgi:hypothetical protein
MAKAVGVSHRGVQRIWATHGLKPHRVRSFKLSNDPRFAAKVRDVVVLYVDSPVHALVLSVDEKSHVWMAPGSKLKDRAEATGYSRSCVRLLRAAPIAAGPMGVRGLEPHQTLGFDTPDFSRFLQLRRYARPLHGDGSSAVCFARSLNSRPPSTAFLGETNTEPKPFVWTAHPDRVIAAVQPGIQAL